MIFKSVFALLFTAVIGGNAINSSGLSYINCTTDISSLDTECRGYGQGRELDDCNRPLGAVMFNDEYSIYDGYAMMDSDKNISLTFDQGYENGYTEPILDTLKEKGVKAVFFLTGDYAERNRELVKRMIDEGHIIGNHGMDHASLPKLSIEDAKNEIMALHDYVKQEYGYEMTYFRPPCGEYSEQGIAVCQSLGYKTLLWSFAYPDWDINNQPERTAAFERVSKASHGGAIYLLHSVSSTNASILGDVIDSMKAEGYNLTTPDL